MIIIKSYIQINNEIIRNPNISSSAFVLYAMLKYLYYKKSIIIYKEKLLEKLNWESNKKLKKYLLELYDRKLINEKYNSLPKFKPLTLTIDNINSKNGFTQLPSILLTNKITIMGDYGIRLLFYYESYINRRSNKNLFAYCSQEIIYKDTGISNKTIIKYNEILQENRLISIDKYELEESINKYGYSFNKYNNHYFVLVENFKNTNKKL